MPATGPFTPLVNPLATWPPWLLVGVGAVVAALALWILAKAVKWLLVLLAVAVLVAGITAAVWLAFAR